MSSIGGRGGAGKRPGIWGESSTTIISDISTNSKSKMHLTTFNGNEAAGLNGSLLDKGEKSCLVGVGA